MVRSLGNIVSQNTPQVHTDDNNVDTLSVSQLATQQLRKLRGERTCTCNLHTRAQGHTGLVLLAPLLENYSVALCNSHKAEQTDVHEIWFEVTNTPAGMMRCSCAQHATVFSFPSNLVVLRPYPLSTQPLQNKLNLL